MSKTIAIITARTASSSLAVAPHLNGPRLVGKFYSAELDSVGMGVESLLYFKNEIAAIYILSHTIYVVDFS